MMAWLGFIGLVLDIVGVLMLIRDVLPEYLNHCLRVRLRQLRLSTDHLKVGDPDRPTSPDDVINTAAAAADLVAGSNLNIYESYTLSVPIARVALKDCANRLKMSDHPAISDAMKPGAFNRQAFDQSLAVLNTAFQARDGALTFRRRPKIMWGAIFIVLGFTFQAYAAMPKHAQETVAFAARWMFGVPE